MKKACSVLLVLTALMNLAPGIGVLSAEHLSSLYGGSFETPDIKILMRHRAVMLALIGGLMLVAAFRSSLQVVAATVGLVSMASFVILAYLVGDGGEKVQNVAVADVAGSIAATIVLVLALKQRHNAN